MSELKTHKIDGISFIERDGPGPCLVFLHGIGSQARSFHALFEQLPPDYHLLAWQTPGYGNSDPVAPEWPIAKDYADALAGLLRARDLGPIILIGHSLGTLIAADFARAYPDMVSCVVLASCAPGYGAQVGGEMPPLVAKRITDLQALGGREFARARAPRLVYQPEDNAEVVAVVEDGMSKVLPHGYAQAVRMLASGRLYETLQHVSVPCRFITATDDLVTPPPQTQAAAEAWANAHGVSAHVEEIEMAGHAVYVQQPCAFAKTLLRLIADHNPNALIGDTND